jgi:hypothetical protein
METSVAEPYNLPEPTCFSYANNNALAIPRR